MFDILPLLLQELYKNPIAWVNTSVFDYRNQLKTGAMSLYAWKVSEDQAGDVMPNPLGTLVSNPDHDQAVTLTVTFPRYHHTSTIIFPSKDKIISIAQESPQCEEVWLSVLWLFMLCPCISKLHQLSTIWTHFSGSVGLVFCNTFFTCILTLMPFMTLS